MRGHLLVVGELLREAAATLRDRTQVEREAQHLRLRHHGLHVLVAVGRLRAEDLRSEEHTSELQSQSNLVCRLLLEKKKKNKIISKITARHINTIILLTI